LVRQSYPRADAVVAVSHQVADDLAQITGLLDERITTIYNPVVDQSLLTQATEPLSHHWFDPAEPPVILGVGRLTEQKDFATLIRAFARVRACKDVRLVILGEGRQHQLLNTLVAELGLQGAVDMPGFVKNPFPYMAKAAMLVLSSKYEGLPGVLIQALACGCPVVSTDCPGGAAEILDNGRYGPLVSVGDVDALARAIDGVLKHPPGKAMLTARSQMFSVDQAASTYLDLLDKIVAAARPATGND
jgi:glycosyltransferase involved in cell wall biosynthesis